MSRLRNKKVSSDWPALVAAALAAVVYAVQSWHYAHTQLSVLDEGAYLVKGLLYALGRYLPFQDFGPSTNHMPLAFSFPAGRNCCLARAFAPVAT